MRRTGLAKETTQENAQPLLHQWEEGLRGQEVLELLERDIYPKSLL